MNKRVLLVDDNSGVRAQLKAILSTQQYDVVEATDGLDGLTKAKKTPHDIFIVDYKMPVMDGITLLKRLKEMPQYSECHMILLTTDNGAEFVNKMIELPTVDVLCKPISQSDLLDVLDKQDLLSSVLIA
jgi:two-component system chemotaxis response regulator CheY